MKGNWILVDSKNYPKDGEIVQITYRSYGSYLTEELACLCFAYRKNGKWLFDDGNYIDEISDERVIAWRDCIPYGCDKAPTI